MKNKKKLCFGVIIGTRAYFNSALAKDVRKQLLKTIEEQGYDYVILPEDATPTGSSSIETREDGIKCAELFRQNRDKIDGIIVSLPNFGFEIGIINAISIADLNVPVLVQACDDENDKVDLDSRRDAFCGKISVCNNLYQYGIPFTDTTLHTYSIYSDLLAKDINRFAAVCRVVNGLRHARIGAIGTRPAGFQTVRASEKILQATGITVVPVDLSEILGAARKIEDTDAELVQKIEEIKKYARVPQQYSEKLMLQAKFECKCYRCCCYSMLGFFGTELRMCSLCHNEYVGRKTDTCCLRSGYSRCCFNVCSDTCFSASVCFARLE